MISTKKEEIFGIFYLQEQRISMSPIITGMNLLYKLITNRLFREIVFPDQHNRQGINNSIPVENHHTQTTAKDHSIDLDQDNRSISPNERLNKHILP